MSLNDILVHMAAESMYQAIVIAYLPAWVLLQIGCAVSYAKWNA